MSSDWNLSSDEEDDFEHWAVEQRLTIPVAAAAAAAAAAQGGGSSSSSSEDEPDENYGKPSAGSSMDTLTMTFPSDFDGRENDGSSEEDDDEVDWEDVGDDNDTMTDGAPDPSAPSSLSKLAANKTTGDPRFAELKAVTVDMGEGRSNKRMRPDKKKRKRSMNRTVFRHDKLPVDLHAFLNNVRKTHLLCLSGHAEFASRYASDDECLHVAHSLIPAAWMAPPNDVVPCGGGDFVMGRAAPTVNDLNHFVGWFVDLVSLRRAETAPARISGRLGWGGRRGGSSRYQKKHIKRVRKGDVAQCPVDTSDEESTIRYRILEYCTHLSNQRHGDAPTNDFPVDGIYNDYDKVLLFLAMARSLRWRVRYVLAMEPMTRDLNVDHPLFVAMSHRNVFLGFWRAAASHGRKNEYNEKNPVVLSDDNEVGDRLENVIKLKRAKRAKANEDKPTKKEAGPLKKAAATIQSDALPPSNSSLYSCDAPPKPLCWIEVLCQSPTSKTRTKCNTAELQWVHVDPALGIVDQPHLVEQALYATHQRIPVLQQSRKRLPLPYALAVEHVTKTSSTPNTGAVDSGSSDLVLRMTDVTRRYASSMVDTLRARGIVQNKSSSKSHRNGQTTTEVDRVDKWWNDFLYSMNHREKKSRVDRNSPPSPEVVKMLKCKGGSIENAIAVESSDDEHAKKLPAMATPGTPAAKLKDDDVNSGAHDEDVDTFNQNLDHLEEKLLRESATKEPLPTSKAAFKGHPIYVIRSVLTSTEVLVPDAKKRACGIFKGELVFLRRDVETAFPAKKWLYRGRKVKESEVKRPILKVKARKVPATQGFKALKSYGVGKDNDGSEEARAQQILDGSEPLGDGKIHLFGSWQTDPWSPAVVGPNDSIPVNEYRNVELELINPGLVHVELERVAVVAKKLQIPYAPCLLGFEGHGGNRTPTIRGIVVHVHNEDLLREAHAEMSSHLLQQEHENRQHSILLRWKRLLVGVLTKDRLENDHGNYEVGG